MKKYYTISGMHCRSCELLIEQHLGEIPGVQKVRVDHRTGAAMLQFDDHISSPDERAIARAIRNAGYELGRAKRIPFINHNADDWIDALTGACILFVLYLGYRILGISQLSAGITAAAGPLSALAIGLVAGISTCMALIGGLVLAVASRHAQRHPAASAWQRFQPHLAFNLGRIMSFAVLGGVIGGLGSVFRLKAGLMGSLIIFAGATMVILGIRLTGLFPRIQNMTLPSGIARLIGMHRTEERPYSHRHTFLMGGATFFLPCAFTQMMQIYAVSTGSIFQGALVLGAFALGTTPGLLGIGGMASLARGSFGRMFMKMAGIGVLLLGFWNVSNGWNLTGITIGTPGTTIQVGGAVAQIRDGKQYLAMEQNAIGYNPNRLRVKVGIPVVWTITSTTSATCAASISVPAYGILQSLRLGQNVITFTPTSTGRIKFSCAMGMITGSIDVVQ